ncbi:MAG: cardiolipin synthase ClsB [Myxococcales bacterium]|nr:cardiolipin synthase ClsB [Myxococcales bacterium]
MSARDDDRNDPTRLRAGLRRHGLVRRPAEVRTRFSRRAVRMSEGNAVDVYDCGRAAFPVMLEAIAAAKRFVHLETYTLRHDAIGRRFLAALADRARAGVDVRLLYDAIGSLPLDRRALEPLRQAGGAILEFNPLRALWPDWAPRRRDHRKLLVVDGRCAFLGGLNIGDEYDAPARPTAGAAAWRDTHARVRGPVVHDLGAVFLESWFRGAGATLPWHELLEAETGRPGDVRCGVLPDGPIHRRRAMRDLLVDWIDEARDHVRLTSPYFAPDRRVLEALDEATRRRVRVELLLAGDTDHPWLRRGARATLERLLRRGVEVHEYVASMLHTKTAVFDGRRAILGTSNLDRQSLQHNYEVNLVIEGPPVPALLDRQFEADLEHAHPLTLPVLARRGPLTRLVDGLAAAVMRGFV